MSINAISIAFARRFFSWKRKTPQINDTTTELRRIIEMMDSKESSLLSAMKYAKSAAESSMDIIGIAHVHFMGEAFLP